MKIVLVYPNGTMTVLEKDSSQFYDKNGDCRLKVEAPRQGQVTLLQALQLNKW